MGEFRQCGSTPNPHVTSTIWCWTCKRNVTRCCVAGDYPAAETIFPWLADATPFRLRSQPSPSFWVGTHSDRLDPTKPDPTKGEQAVKGEK